MPRRKNDATSSPAIIKKEKAPRKRIIKETPESRSPVVGKYKRPPARCLDNLTLQSSKAKLDLSKAKLALSKAETKAQLKIQLANEVALAQLVKPGKQKPEPLEKPPDQESPLKAKARKKPPIPKKPPGKKALQPPKAQVRRGRPKKNPLPAKELNIDTPATDTMEDSVKTVFPPKKSARKLPMKAESETTEVKCKPVNSTNKRKADSTSAIPVKRQTKPKDLTISKPKPPPKREPSPRKRNNYVRKVKVRIDDVSTTDQPESPSILTSSSTNAIKTTEIPNENLTHTPISCPGAVESRKSSLTSASEALSWTKDISSSSTTTCMSVRSNDFFLIDNKLPVLKLPNIKDDMTKMSDINKIEGDSSSDSESTSSSTESSSDSSSTSSGSSTSRPLNLSSSSSSPVNTHMTTSNRSYQSIVDNERATEISKLLDKLKKVDIEGISWVGCENDNKDNDEDIEKFQNMAFEVLKEEREILIQCRNLKMILSDQTNSCNNYEGVVNSKSSTVHGNERSERSKSRDSVNTSDRSEDDDNFTTSRSKNIMLNQNSVIDNSLHGIKGNADSKTENCTSDKLKYIPFENNYNNDDDDALSLYAESLTAIDSSHFSSVASICGGTDIEEYVPLPLSRDRQSEKATYYPTKIDDNAQSQQQRTKSVCEKQRADSTSIHREKSQNTRMSYDSNESESLEGTDPGCPKNTNTISHAVMEGPQLMAHFNKPANAVKSLAFKGVCFFNLISNCKSASCAFKHLTLDINKVTSRLSAMNDQRLIEEYMLMRSFPDLRYQYGILFVDECQKRGLTRIIVEMAIDFIAKAKINCAQDKYLQVTVTERVLMHLNNIDFKICSDLLKYNLGDKLLCDVLMQTIAETQNFSRFKAVFVKLTEFITGMGRSFCSDVAVHILERVSILPFELSVSRAMIAIIQNTDKVVFANSMMRQFELQLLKNDENLHAVLLETKKQTCESRPSLTTAPIASPYLYQSSELMSKPETARADRERFTSPDTTKMDSSNKPAMDAVVIRTIGKHVAPPRIMEKMYSAPGESAESYIPPPNMTKPPQNNYKQWRGARIASRILGARSGMYNTRYPRPMPVRGMPPRMMRGNGPRHVAYGLAQSMYSRRPGPDFY